jgi:hypothetical protein
MSKKLFYDEKGKDSEIYYPLQEWINTCRIEKRDIILVECCYDLNGESFCPERITFEPECGKFCDSYKPCNGKSGKCVHLKKSLIGTGRELLLTYDSIGGKIDTKKISMQNTRDQCDSENKN